ncbi:hypothetical protein C1875_08975 [Eggerthella lenta]|uniref:Uncharacterized protein n=1 Tax=Eggerthella lenta TaxID=84112 RepID=A0A369MGR4_EGGLN|nr:hypothetical protein [Eggerthella lenta]RDB69769.1 hypothetical protein C1875_08975 [Eggerthella lenta]
MSDSEHKPHYILRPVTTPVAGSKPSEEGAPPRAADPFLRPAQEDDDGYDPFSDRPADPDPAFQEDPWR